MVKCVFPFDATRVTSTVDWLHYLSTSWPRGLIQYDDFFIDGLEQKIRNSSALAMELRLFYIKPSICIGIPFVVLVYLISIMDFSIVIRDGRVPDRSISIANSLEVFVSHQAIAKTTFSHWIIALVWIPQQLATWIDPCSRDSYYYGKMQLKS